MADYIKLFADENAYNAFTGTSDFVTPNVSVCSGGGGSIFYNPKHNYSKDYLTTVARTDGTIIFNGSVSGSSSNTMSYSTDNGTTWSTAIQEPSVNVNAGDKVLWKGTCTPYSSVGIGKFTNGTATFDVEGNVMSLLYGNDFKGQTSLEGKNYAFYNLFSGNTKVISAENLSLPATTLSNQCYYNMFRGCTSLITAPKLPAMTLASSCYQYMFNGCTSLTTAPELPATALANSCYYGMFGSCRSLTTAPALPATALANNCYRSMFSYCSRLSSAPELPATNLTNGCYQSMFEACSSLKTAPELPATTLANSCYSNMFSACTRLNSITCLATYISASYCTSDWLDGVASSGTFTKNASMTSWGTGSSGIPSGWSVFDKQ